MSPELSPPPAPVEAPELLGRVPAHHDAPAAAPFETVPAAPFGFSLLPSMPDIFFIALVLWLFCAGPLGWVSLLADGDTGWHIRTGETVLDTGRVPSTDPYSFSKPGEAWYAWEWLADVIFAALHRAWGLAGVVLLAGVLIAGSATVLLSHMVWRGASFLVALPLTVIVVGVSSNHYLARPHVFTLFLLPVALWIIDADRRRQGWAVWSLIPLAAVWTNLHGGFLALIACVGLLAAGSLLECLPDWAGGRRSPREATLGRYLGLAAGCSLATLANPFGYGLHLHIANYLQSTFIHEVVQEFQSPSFRGEAMLQFELLLMAALVAAGVSLVSARRDWAGILWVLFWTHQALHAVRHSSIFALVAAPLVAAVASDRFHAWAAGQSRKSVAGIFRDLGRDAAQRFRWASPWPMVFLAGLAVTGAPTVHWPKDFPAERFPLALMHAHRELYAAHRTLTMDQWADYLIYQSYPRQRVFVDGRSDFYGPKLGREYLRLMNGAAGWEKLLEQHRFEVALVPREWALDRLLAQSSDWREIARLDRPATAAATLYVRRGSAADRAPASNETPSPRRITTEAVSGAGAEAAKR